MADAGPGGLVAARFTTSACSVSTRRSCRPGTARRRPAAADRTRGRGRAWPAARPRGRAAAAHHERADWHRLPGRRTGEQVSPLVRWWPPPNVCCSGAERPHRLASTAGRADGRAAAGGRADATRREAVGARPHPAGTVGIGRWFDCGQLASRDRAGRARGRGRWFDCLRRRWTSVARPRFIDLANANAGTVVRTIEQRAFATLARSHPEWADRRISDSWLVCRLATPRGPTPVGYLAAVRHLWPCLVFLIPWSPPTNSVFAHGRPNRESLRPASNSGEWLAQRARCRPRSSQRPWRTTHRLGDVRWSDRPERLFTTIFASSRGSSSVSDFGSCV